VTDRRPDETADDLLDEEGPGSDPGAAYRRAADAEETAPDEEDERGPDVGDVYRSGS
jgi:hypothetical protein